MYVVKTYQYVVWIELCVYEQLDVWYRRICHESCHSFIAASEQTSHCNYKHLYSKYIC